jgi:Zn-dependent protease/predicted transcriptional regulator
VFGKSFTIAHIGGIAIEIHPSWLLIVALVSWSLAVGVFPAQYEGWSTATYWIIGVVAAVLLFVTVLIHELAHAVVAIRRGLPVPRITLFIFGGVSHLSRQPRTAGEEFFIAAAGPATSFVIAIVAGIIAILISPLNEQATAIAFYLAIVNLLLAVFNTLPGFPLDGGRVLRSIAWRKTGSFRTATRIAAGVGTTFGFGLMVVGFGFLLFGYILNGIWFAFIGWFLSSAARGEADSLRLETALGPLSARDIMSEHFVTVPPGLSVQLIVDEFMVGEGHRAVVVARDDAVYGIVSISDIRKLPRDRWPDTPAQTIMTPREDVLTVQSDTPAMEVLELIAQRGLNQLPVLEEGRMVGLVTRREIIERIQLAEQLQDDRKAPTFPDVRS